MLKDDEVPYRLVIEERSAWLKILLVVALAGVPVGLWGGVAKGVISGGCILVALLIGSITRGEEEVPFWKLPFAYQVLWLAFAIPGVAIFVTTVIPALNRIYQP